MFIEVHATPNVNSLKFHPGRTVLKDGTYDFPNARAVCGIARIVWTRCFVQRALFCHDVLMGRSLSLYYLAYTRTRRCRDSC
jgi:hypothetical protein